MTRKETRLASFCLALSAVIAVLAAGCGSADPAPVERTEEPAGRSVVFVTSTPGPRPTLRPTFTPVPTPTATAVPTATPFPTATPLPTATLVPTATLEAPAEPAVESTAEPTATAEPMEEPAGGGDTVIVGGRELEVPGVRIELPEGMGYVSVELQALFPYQYEDPPRFLTHGDVSWPAGESFISKGSRYVYWAIMFDDSEAEPGWTLPLFIRWVDRALYASNGTIMLEAPSEASEGRTVIYQGVGRATPGFWRAGDYEVFLLDRQFGELMSHTFEVR